MDDWNIDALDSRHQRGDFSCGKAALDRFLHSFTNQYERRNLGRTYVAVRPGDNRVSGYYSLASAAIPFQSLPVKASKKLPKHPVPAALLARLAIDQSVQGTGLGRLLLVDAFRRCLDLASQIGIYAVMVDALDQQPKTFYEKFGFTQLLDDPMHLYLPIATIKATFG